MTTIGLVALDVAALDAAAAQHPDAHRLEVAAGDRAEERDRRRSCLAGYGPPFDAQRVAGAAARQRQARRGGHGRHAGQRREPIEDRVMGGDRRVARRVVAIRQSDAERERRRGVEARIHRAQLLEAADHEPGRHEEHQRQRDLRRPSARDATRWRPRLAVLLRPLSCSDGGERRAAPQRNRAEHQRGDQAQHERERERRRRPGELRGGAAAWRGRRPTSSRTAPAGERRGRSRRRRVESSTLSVRKKRAMPRRPAPSARRTATSRCRASERTRNRFATFAQATSSTSADRRRAESTSARATLPIGRVLQRPRR